MTTVIIDAMGGDNAPFEIVKGGLTAAAELGVKVIFAGDEADIRASAKSAGMENAAYEVIHTSEVFAMEDDPALISREKSNTSLALGLKALSEGKGDAFVTAGSTGALLTGATLFVKRIKGIRRAALAPIIPTAEGGALLIDCGANVDCTPEYLLQFGVMGGFYAEKVMGRQKARVGLLNIGAEETKGGALRKDAYKYLKKAGGEGRINFVGNVEGRDVMLGTCDVVVSDGYSGNIMLKTMEGVGIYFSRLLKGMFYKNILTKLAALLVKGELNKIKKLMDYTETGGAPLMGISKPVIKAHGSSNAKALKNAVRQAVIYHESGMVNDIMANIDSMTIAQNARTEA